VSSAIIAFGALFAYPALLLVARGADPAGRAAIHRGQVAVGRHVTLPALLALFLFGAYLASDRGLWDEVWVTIPVTIWFLLGAIGSGFVLPRERRLAELAAGGGGPDYDRALAQVRLATYAGLALVLVAAFFMVTKAGA
jgi:small-conductance mechanosensitive channel